MDIKRRRFIKLAGFALATGAVASLFPFALRKQLPDTATRLTQFSRLSHALTANDALSDELVETNFNFLLAENQRTLLKTLDTIETLPSDAALHQWLTNTLANTSDVSTLLKNLTKLWYFGSYNDKTISIKAYQQSLVWRAIGTTARGTPYGNQWNIASYLL